MGHTTVKTENSQPGLSPLAHAEYSGGYMAFEAIRPGNQTATPGCSPLSDQSHFAVQTSFAPGSASAYQPEMLVEQEHGLVIPFSLSGEPHLSLLPVYNAQLQARECPKRAMPFRDLEPTGLQALG